ncbi:hypothetical protein [Flavobacterium sp.]|uniref:hypothetical protein n=1 Tax=Flavobacterium sp. TaxID=239 RepID=UPI0038FD04DB
MKNKIKFQFLISCFTCLSAFAQSGKLKTYTHKSSAPYEEEKPYSGMFLGRSSSTTFYKGNEFMTCDIQNEDIIIKKFNAEKLSLVKEKKYNKFFAKNFVLMGNLEINNKFFVFYSSYDGDAKKEQVFSTEIDFNKGEFASSPKLLFQVDKGILPSNSFSFYFNLTESFDKKYIAINYRKVQEKNKGDKNAKDIIGIKEFDENLKQVFASEINMSYSEKEVDCGNYILNNNGDFYWLAKVYHDDSHNDKKKSKDIIANFHFEIFSIKSGAKTINTTKVEDKNNTINVLNLFTTPKDFILCAGTYSNGSSDIMDTDGYVGFKINADGTFSDKVYSEFTIELLKQYTTEKEQKNIDKPRTKGESNGLLRVALQDSHVSENGDLVFIGEQKYSVTNTYSPATSMSLYSDRTMYFDKDIIISKVKTDGNVVWTKRIPKNELSVPTCSYAYSKENNYFIFVDDIHNIDLPLNKKPGVAYGGHDEFMSIVKVSDSDGTVSKGAIFDNEEFKNYDVKKYMVYYKDPFKISENEIVFKIHKTKGESGDVMVKVKLD